MKKISITFILLTLFAFAAKANNKAITAHVVFENLTDKILTQGEFYVTGLDQKIELTSEKSFSITLPKSGRYQFGFYSETFDSYVYYPARITAHKNTITIRLKDIEKKGRNSFLNSPIKYSLSDKAIEQKIENNELDFIIHGLNNTIPQEYQRFKEKYGIGFTIKNCIIDPITLKETSKNNQTIFDYLNRKYGDEWQKDLPIKPFGIK
ncbi:hypothetical protein V6R21_10920 [Limibacter armeniacum]|uniref:FEKKY domain-containing protein n=1 Tax=Limibacter armeniacum TaxID=466084 RepID=UPI002FE5BFBF